MVAVDLGGRGDEDGLAEAPARVEDGLGALEVDPQGADGLLDDRLDADGGREVVDDVDLVHELGDDRGVQHAVDHEMEVGVVGEVGDVLQAAGREVVDDEHLVAVGEKKVGEVRADETGPTRDQCSHSASPVVGFVTKRVGEFHVHVSMRGCRIVLKMACSIVTR